MLTHQTAERQEVTSGRPAATTPESYFNSIRFPSLLPIAILKDNKHLAAKYSPRYDAILFDGPHHHNNISISAEKKRP
jgi:hypothetical protein